MEKCCASTSDYARPVRLRTSSASGVADATSFRATATSSAEIRDAKFDFFTAVLQRCLCAP